MNLEIKNEILESFNTNDLKVFFINSWCEWTKIDITDVFDKKWLEIVKIWWKNIYFDKKDFENLNNWKILLKSDNNSNHSSDDKYLFISDKIKSRCNCSSSFSFENKLIDSNKLKKLKKIFRK